VIAPIDKVMPTVRRGDFRGASRSWCGRAGRPLLPRRTIDAQEAWVELEAVDDQGA